MRIASGEHQDLGVSPDPVSPEAAASGAPNPTAAERALLDAFQSGMHAIALFDAQDRLVYSNDMFRTVWAIDSADGVTFASMIRNCHVSGRGVIVDSVDIDGWLAKAAQSRRQGSSDRAFEVDLWDGRWMWVTERRLTNGSILLIAQDITALKASERSLRQARDAAVHASLTDPLTGLPNRRAALQILNASVRRQESFHVAIVDIDNFKQINDRFGHQTGDEVLTLFSADLRILQGLSYYVARLAGDEFLILGPADESRQAFEASLQSLLRMRTEQCLTCKTAHIFAVSIGAASYPVGGSTAKDLLVSADRAMYVAKSMGRSTLSFVA